MGLRQCTRNIPRPPHIRTKKKLASILQGKVVKRTLCQLSYQSIALYQGVHTLSRARSDDLTRDLTMEGEFVRDTNKEVWCGFVCASFRALPKPVAAHSLTCVVRRHSPRRAKIEQQF